MYTNDSKNVHHIYILSICFYLFSEWRLFNHQSKEQELYHKQIIRWFSDFPSDQSPFSIHALVRLGEKTGKRPGDWYGPASVAHILK